MSWNFRVVKYELENSPDPLYKICEVYYHEDGSVRGWIEEKNPVLHLSSVDSIQWAAEKMLEACQKPVLVQDGNTLVEEAG